MESYDSAAVEELLGRKSNAKEREQHRHGDTYRPLSDHTADGKESSEDSNGANTRDATVGNP